MREDPLSALGILIAVAFLGISIVVVATGGKLAPYNPSTVDMTSRFLPPSFKHPMGTDSLGRDVFSRVILSFPIDAEICIVIVGISLTIGLVIGSISGYHSGRVDQILMRITDIFLAFPVLIFAIAIAVALGPSINHVIEACLIVWWPAYARLARAGALSLRESQFVEAAKVAGLSHLTIIRKHIVPNNISPLLIYATLDIGTAIIYTWVLELLGAGRPATSTRMGKHGIRGAAIPFSSVVGVDNAWRDDSHSRLGIQSSR